MDNNGIPQTAEKRYEIAEKILMRAQSIGIPKEDVFIDCLTLTIAADQQNAQITLDAVKKIKQLNLKTVLGISNVSFGLPMRNRINNTFLTMALQSGLDLPIINPNAQDTMDCQHLSSAGQPGNQRALYSTLCGSYRGFIETFAKAK